MNALNAKAFAGLLLLNLIAAALLFVPAGTFDYWQAWAFLVVYFVPSLAITLYLMKHDRALLTRRMRGGPFAEKEPAQRLIMSLASLGFIGLIALPALDHRFAWSHMPPAVALAGDGLILLAWLAVFLVFKENTFSAATVQLAVDQKVISTGPYALIRHPMYAAGLLMLAAMPIALGSWWGLLILVAILPALLWRLLDEEKFLIKSLPGYVAYQGKVRYRLIPLIW
ncbi:MAG TPA: isoprenylcysteine carboxylmethyltransferase family protein [Stellaceae bacterium]|nr:isoprenylcysteine carboxylmethyltransferase family protein [Stellaceae bacterium]